MDGAARGTGPLVAGPSSAAGPPPTIPAELPPPPAGAISISAVKVKEKEEEEKKKGFDLSDLRRRTSTRTLRTPPATGPTRRSPRRRWTRARPCSEPRSTRRRAQVRHGRRPLARLAAGRRRPVPAKRKRVLLRSVSEGARHDRRFVEEVSQHAAPRHGDRPRVRHGPLLGAIVRRQARWPVTPNVTDGTRPMFDTFGYAVQAYERVRTVRSQGPVGRRQPDGLGQRLFPPRAMERRR